ncbi:DUF421 domain-containing protein [Planococcus sp. CP5-4]|uniref:DUF421 domain-containing protein n=1 Tax=Planococcus TaxID=1372 RepID=UPI001B8BD69E|nr:MULTISPECIES: YetF domain-containing protein [unclassified Planococcus (in: firmicutes)]MBU9673232.1 DUF421 domain-containing protein [Planococcus sp. CP5-4_YE]MBW6062540.1 DUF421 domain-containing protein [Planococcus sp. CP5-4]MDN5708215.1 DUF421 domain-containing protein [Planococcus sp. (in: firmicutes)]
MFEITWDSFIRIITVGVLAYIGLLIFLRTSGKRTLTKLNAFDLVVTVALGSTLATILLNSQISLWEGLTAFAVLIGLQYLLTFTAVRLSWFNDLIKSEPRLLFLEGEFLQQAMRKERVKDIEIMQAVRNSGEGDLQNVKAVILETDGSMSIISNKTGSALANVKGHTKKDPV